MIDGLIYDWNTVNAPPRPRTVMLDDETLRDGLQSPSVRTPSIEDKLRITIGDPEQNDRLLSALDEIVS